MTDPRKSVAIAKEAGNFGSGQTENTYEGKPVFFTLPPGAWLSHTNEYSNESIFATGSKLRETAAYGNFKGSFTLNFVLDYEHTEVLDLIMEDHTVSSTPTHIGNTDYYEHTWKKDNATRIPPFVIREKQLNRIAAGGPDEVVILKGCVAQSMKASRSQQTSKWDITLTGHFADMEVQLAELSMTDYTTYDTDVGPVQYSCMFMDGLTADNYVRDVDQHSFSIDCGTSLVYNTCTPFATAYFEGQSTIQWDAQTFSNRPTEKFQLRPFSGGKDSQHLKPLAKGLAPMAKAYFVSYSLSMRDEDLPSITDAIDQSPYFIKVIFTDSTVATMEWPSGDGSKIMDVLSSVQCTSMEITIRNKHSTANWSNKIIGANASEGKTGTGPDYTPILLNGEGKLRPTVSTEDPDLGGSAGSPVTINMASGDYITVNSADLLRGIFLKNATVNVSIIENNSVEGWFVVPYSIALYDVPSGGSATLQDLLGLDNTSAAALAAPGLTLITDWEEVSTDISGTDTVVKYIPVTTITGTPTTAGEYKYYIVKGHILPGDTKTLVVTDRGILRINVAAST